MREIGVMFDFTGMAAKQKRPIQKWRSWVLPTKLGIILGIVGALGLLLPNAWSVWSNYRESRAWTPARKSVLAEVGNTYTRLFYLARNIAKPDDGSPRSDAPSVLHYQQNVALIGYGQNAVGRLQEAIKTNNSALNSEVLPTVAAFAHDADRLLALLSYFSEFQNPRWEKWEFVTESPSDLFHRLAQEVRELHAQYPDILKSGADLPSNLPDVDELDQLWINWETANSRLSFYPEKYTWKPGVEPVVFNPANLRRLPPPSGQNQQRAVYVMYGYR